MADFEYDGQSRGALELFRDSDCSVYGCEYIALATNLGIK